MGLISGSATPVSQSSAISRREILACSAGSWKQYS